MNDLEREITKRLNADPTIRALFSGRQPRFRYWQTPDGAMFVYTTEAFSDCKYGSAIYQPTGEGSRSGRKAVTAWEPIREVHHATRKAAKARALALYAAHDKAHPEWGSARTADLEKRNLATRLRYFQKTGRWHEEMGWGPVPTEAIT